MTLKRGEALDRQIERFLVERAEEAARQSAPAERVAAMLAVRQDRRAPDRPRLIVALALLLAAAVVVALIGAAQRSPGATVGPISGNLTWSPDGSLLAFSTLELVPQPDASSRFKLERAIGIWVVGADGTGLRRLARDLDDSNGFRTGASMSWSPDGRFLAYDLGLRPNQTVAIQAI
jgi:hypothetical protein